MSEEHRDPRADPNLPPAGGFGAPTGPAAFGPAQGPSEAGMGYVAPDGTAQRGGCLTAFLVLMMIANPATALVYLAAGQLITKALPHAPSWTAPVMGVCALMQFACAIGIWRWQKWGVYGSVALAALAFFVNLAIGLSPVNAIFGLAGPVILIALIEPIWRGFR